MVDVIAEPLCVFCRQRSAEDPWRPFCSERCKLEDLARWLDGRYRVPGQPVSNNLPAEDRDNDSENDAD